MRVNNILWKQTPTTGFGEGGAAISGYLPGNLRGRQIPAFEKKNIVSLKRLTSRQDRVNQEEQGVPSREPLKQMIKGRLPLKIKFFFKGKFF